MPSATVYAKQPLNLRETVEIGALTLSVDARCWEVMSSTRRDAKIVGYCRETVVISVSVGNVSVASTTADASEPDDARDAADRLKGEVARSLDVSLYSLESAIDEIAQDVERFWRSDR